ncbi:MAG: DUF3347 domain-containing protein [Ferruginibacter sp.]
MKKIFLGLLAFTTISLTACGNNTNGSSNNQSAIVETAIIKQAVIPTTVKTTAASITDILNAYLQMKNAFTKDNSNAAADAGKILKVALINFDTKALSTEAAANFNDIADDAKEHADHIGMNAGNIKHQREHFEMLSKDIADLVKTFGNGGQTLYKDFCPMANNGKGAIWISEIKGIKNPYFGKAMSTCGTVKEEIKQ